MAAVVWSARSSRAVSAVRCASAARVGSVGDRDRPRAWRARASARRSPRTWKWAMARVWWSRAPGRSPMSAKTRARPLEALAAVWKSHSTSATRAAVRNSRSAPAWRRIRSSDSPNATCAAEPTAARWAATASSNRPTEVSAEPRTAIAPDVPTRATTGIASCGRCAPSNAHAKPTSPPATPGNSRYTANASNGLHAPVSALPHPRAAALRADPRNDATADP
ncbi:hypothetical protein ACOBQX_26045 [Actinokineospora sp. G85]|uniref:hypothetical protein n=1 Tax=Actinokineospora sp. G85 TaxID=3406626 RepID=UPI003C71EFFC